MKYSYLVMIVEAIQTLNERGGSSAKAIWKFILNSKKYQDSIKGDQRVFLASLKRCYDSGAQVVRNKNNRTRYQLDASFRGKLLRKLGKGEEIHLAMKHVMTVKTSDPKKKVSKRTKAKKAKTAKGKAKQTKARNTKSKKASKARVTKNKDKKDAQKKKDGKAAKAAKNAKVRSAQNKNEKSKGSKVNKAVKGAKAQKQDKKVK